MKYYEVLVGDLQYHGKSALTYKHSDVLLPGSVVRIALRNRSVLGIVSKEVVEPSFIVKPISVVAPGPPLSSHSLALIDWLYEYYPAPFGSIVRQFLPPTPAFPRGDTAPSEPAQVHPADLPNLTDSQRAAVERIESQGYHLLHGVTGSGKTRVYIALAERTIKAGQSVIMLTPEIGLSAQLTQSFEASFPGQVRVLHSRMTSAARRNIWYEILASNTPLIVIGPRSALFAPLRSIGLIIIDESHDQAYKSETAPHYRTERIAAKLAMLHNACLVSGSATPSIEDYYIASAKHRPIIRMKELAVQHDTRTSTEIVDLRDRSQLTRSSILSDPLLRAVQQSLDANEQTLLFLNRRGTAGTILCSTCGWRALCEHCDLALTYHGDVHRLRCHVCGRSQQLPSSCPECGGSDILLKTIGTKAVADEVQRLFPGARIRRFDADTHKSEQLEALLPELRDGSTDIIIGTQMVTKGIDLPNLSVVGILNADSSMLIPDFSATERTFQLLTQVIGRGARGHRASTTVIQTFQPDNPIFELASRQDWDTFYEQELVERRTYRFPPFTQVLRLACLRPSSEKAEAAARKEKERLQTLPHLIVEGPAPAFHPKESGKYRWQLVVKSPSRQILLDAISSLPAGWSHDIDPVDLL